jgi:uncharacterized membrane protein
MAKIRVKSAAKQGAKSKQSLVRENIRAIPCLLLIVLVIVLVSYVFYLGLSGS